MNFNDIRGIDQIVVSFLTFRNAVSTLFVNMDNKACTFAENNSRKGL